MARQPPDLVEHRAGVVRGRRERLERGRYPAA
jgi:hypothetical protein